MYMKYVGAKHQVGLEISKFLHREIPYYDKYLDINKSNKNETQINEINSIINSINKNRLNGVTEYKTLKPLFNQLTKKL